MCDFTGKPNLQQNYVGKCNGLQREGNSNIGIIYFCNICFFAILKFIFSDTICAYMNPYTL